MFNVCFSFDVHCLPGVHSQVLSFEVLLTCKFLFRLFPVASLLLVAMPFAPSSILAPSSDARSP